MVSPWDYIGLHGKLFGMNSEISDKNQVKNRTVHFSIHRQRSRNKKNQIFTYSSVSVTCTYSSYNLYFPPFCLPCIFVFAESAFHTKCKHILSFLGHRSRRLQWPIVITRCPSSVVCRLSVRQFTFSTSSPEPLDGFWWNLVWVKYLMSLRSVVVFRPDPPRGGSRAGQK